MKKQNVFNIGDIGDDGFTLITHKSCTDGTFSALVAKKFCRENAIPEPTIVFEQYGKDTRAAKYYNIINNRDVIMCDFSYDRETIINIRNRAKSLRVLDHHISAEKSLIGLDYCTFDMKKSGAMLMWDYFYPGQPAPRIIEFVQDRDIWNWVLEDSHEFSAGLELHQDFQLMQDYDINYIFSDEFVDLCIAEGKSVLAYQKTVIDRVVATTKSKNAIKETHLFNIGGYEVPVINNANLISEIGHELSKGYPFSVQYFFTNQGEIVFSLRSQPDGVDVSKVAKCYGGGGHRAAAGFSFGIKEISLDKFFSTRNLHKSILTGIKVNSIEELKEILGDSDTAPQDFCISNGMFRSSKSLMLYGDKVNILNEIDDTEQLLSFEELKDASITNIGTAITNGTFYKY